MKTIEFKLGFWHPFGDHSGECAKDILIRKREEAERTGWTLWSFQFRPEFTLQRWYERLRRAPRGQVVAFCSAGRGVAPGGKSIECRSYRYINSDQWQSLTGLGFRVPHAFAAERCFASAFVVSRVEQVRDIGIDHPPVEWLYKNEIWQHHYGKGAHRRSGIPTRGEYLIQPRATGARMRPICAILYLKPPFLAHVCRHGFKEARELWDERS